MLPRAVWASVSLRRIRWQKSTRVRSPISVPEISEAAASALPCQTMPASISRRIIEKKALDDHSIDKDEIDMIVKEMTPKAINNVTVMVIEDDPDMLEQIKSELSVYFHVETFMNGKTGYENIRKIKPALLISDIPLPEMSGYEIVSNLKADPETQDL